VPIASVTAAEQPATLPFTGFDVVPVAIGGLALLCLGLVVRRRTRDGRS
jgi:LPXTG-motif cell wall-anchored protein